MGNQDNLQQNCVQQLCAMTIECSRKSLPAKTACAAVQQKCVQQCAHDLTCNTIEYSKNCKQRKLILYLDTLSFPLPAWSPACRTARTFIAKSGIWKFMSILAFVAVTCLQNQIYSNKTAHTKKAEDTQLWRIDFLCFTFCVLLFVAQLAPSLPCTDRPLPPELSRPAHPHPTPGPPRPTPGGPTLPTAWTFAFFFQLLFLSFFLSRCVRVEFQELRAPPSRLNIFGSAAASRQQRLVWTWIFKCPIGLWSFSKACRRSLGGWERENSLFVLCPGSTVHCTLYLLARLASTDLARNLTKNLAKTY